MSLALLDSVFTSVNVFGSRLRGVVAIWKMMSFVCFTPIKLSQYLYRGTTSQVDCIFFLCALLFLSSLFCLMGIKTMGSANLSGAWLAEELASVTVFVVMKL